MAEHPSPAKGDVIHGFRVLRTEEVPSLFARFFELVHEATGARYIHIASQDEENAFAVGFKTVPTDSTGIAHILEHTVLCGSRNYPVKDPFFSMLKRSLATFMNAFTSSDWTMYPFCTQNKKDFDNLLSVYLDAAFFPRLDELSFKQEGVRLSVNESAGEGEPSVRFDGVVYNEMKGAMSSPDQIMTRSMMAQLYPDTTYGNNSGGEPAEIPNLTHEDLLEFHRVHYHPSNAFFFSWGTFDLAGHLARVQEQVMGEFSRIDPGTDVAHQPRWDAPRTARITYPVARVEKNKAQAALGWLVCGIEDSFEVLSMSILERILIGHSASPLRKALLDSGLGAALADGTGLDTDMIDCMFCAGLKDIAEADDQKVADVVLTTLGELAEKGVDKELAETAIRQYEFSRKEITNQPFGYGLKLLLAFMEPWLHGADPLPVLLFEKDLERVRKEAAKGLFERLIQERFLDNPHRVLLTMAPDAGEAARREEEEKQRLFEAEKNLPPGGLEQVRAQDGALAERQEAPEDLSVLPTLQVSDIPPGVPSMDEDPSLAKPMFTAYDAATNGIVYVSLAGDLSGLPEDLLPLAPLFAHVLSKMGSDRRDYVALTKDIAANTGGISASVAARTRFMPRGEPAGLFVVNAKALAERADKMMDLLEEIVLGRAFSDHARLKTLVQEYAAGLWSSLVHNGHRYAITLAARGFTPSRALAEAWHGVHQVQAARDLAKDLSPGKLEDLAQKLSEVGRRAFAKGALTAGLAGEHKDLSAVASRAEELLDRLSPGPSSGGPPAPGASDFREAWITSTSVSFAAYTLPVVRMEHPDCPVLYVASKLLRSGFLHREIREKGGAYGGFALANPEDGLFAMASYRDPHIARTLSVFENACKWLGEGAYSDQDISEAILQAAGEIDRPDSPGIAAKKAFARKLLGLSDATREEFKNRVLAVDRKRIQEIAKTYFQPETPLAPVAVITGESQLARANRKLGEAALEKREI
ncbi:MAG: insulinase family protein [Deltaproteobacteria bacterium]|nr:insulinase family protein [Deltaproteobacteria bacterium]